MGGLVAHVGFFLLLAFAIVVFGACARGGTEGRLYSWWTNARCCRLHHRLARLLPGNPAGPRRVHGRVWGVRACYGMLSLVDLSLGDQIEKVFTIRVFIMVPP